MKLPRQFLITLFLTFTLLLPNASAQDYTKWSLPDGATARLGKGTCLKMSLFHRIVVHLPALVGMAQFCYGNCVSYSTDSRTCISATTMTYTAALSSGVANRGSKCVTLYKTHTTICPASRLHHA